MPPSLITLLVISGFIRCDMSMLLPAEPQAGQPMIIDLRRESVPVKRQGKVVSFKTSYSGVIAVGSPIPQPFRVVFDTGSGHVVIPAAKCESPACLVHERFNSSASQTAVRLNANGSPVPAGELCDQVHIGFGTGQITGELMRDQVCFGSQQNLEGAKQNPNCVEVNVVVAVEMSTQPFKSFKFDGIVGLGWSSLALSDEFSFFDRVAKSGKVKSAHFGVFLTEGDVEGEDSELAIGGYDAKRFLHPLAWAPVANSEHGYWQVHILAVRVDGKELDVCRDGTCRGVVDTGTSHLGIPAPHDREVAGLLTVDAGDMLDCRSAHSPVIEIELESINITLSAENYMRKLPLNDALSLGSATGVVLPGVVVPTDGGGANETSGLESAVEESQTSHCRPRLMPVNLPEPVGPKLFILGEPVLHRYYTVYDWKGLQVGFSLANNQRNIAQLGSASADPQGAFQRESLRSLRGLARRDAMHLMQQSVVTSSGHDEDEDTVLFVQVAVYVNIRSA